MEPCRQELLRACCKAAMLGVLDVVDAQLTSKEYLMGDFSIVKATL
jgi:hypothetical protein